MGEKTGKVVEYRVGSAAVTSQRYFSVERLLLSISRGKDVGSKYSDALPIPVKEPGK